MGWEGDGELSLNGSAAEQTICPKTFIHSATKIFASIPLHGEEMK
jgi:hypothetical protein